jgi:hypothetical protein
MSEYVTRREFYSALSTVWFFISLVIGVGDLVLRNPSWHQWVLWGLAVVLALIYLVLSIWASVAKKQPDKPA